jgi:hypothetical protein
MDTSLFTEYVAKWFSKVITSITEKVNGKEGAETYFFKQFLKKDETTDLTWNSLESNGSVAAVSVVSMDSELPLHKRDAIKKASGLIPKLGGKMALNEKQLSDLKILALKGNKESALVVKLFADALKLVAGVSERLEYMFLQALSSGVTSIDEGNGVGIRIDFGIPAANKFETSGAVWATVATSKPLDDIQAVLDGADVNGHVITNIFMDRATIAYFRNSTQVKDQYAAFTGVQGAGVLVPNFSKVNEFLNAEYGVQIIEVNKSVKIEKSGVQTSVKPWTAGAVTFTTTLDLGSLTFGELAEKTSPVSGVAYESADDYILVSKYRKNDPLQEVTSVQALVLPVLQNVGALYILDTTTAA